MNYMIYPLQQYRAGCVMYVHKKERYIMPSKYFAYAAVNRNNTHLKAYLYIIGIIYIDEYIIERTYFRIT